MPTLVRDYDTLLLYNNFGGCSNVCFDDSLGYFYLDDNINVNCLTVNCNTSFSCDITVTNNALVCQDLTVNGSLCLSNDLDLGTNKILYSNVYSQFTDLPCANDYHGMFAHVHGTGKGYFAHAGQWHCLLDATSSTTSELSEGTNLYFTNDRSRCSVCASGDLSYNCSTGEFNVTTYKSCDFDTDFAAKFTCDLTECGDLYFTDARARLSLCGTGDITYCNTTGEINVVTYKTCDFDTDFGNKFTCDLTECGDLYFTDARSRASLCGGTGVTYCDTSGEISIGQDVSCTSNVTFNNVTVLGTLNSDDVTASNVYICGDLTVTGTTTSVNSSVVNIGDINILLACGATTPAQANGGGITLGGANACIYYDNVTDTWNLNKDLCVSCLIGQISDVSNHFTCDIAECGDLYFTDARARLSLCGSGDVTYCNTTGEISVTTYKSCDFDTDFATKFTCDLTECGDLYFTDARARLSLCGTGDITYCDTTGEINAVTYKSCDFDTDFAAKFTCDLTECGDLYFTDARARLSLCGTGDITYCNTTGEISVTTYKSCDFDTDFATKFTCDLTECGDLYFTDARSRASLCGTGDITYCNTTGEINVITYKSCDFDTDFATKFTCDLTECGDLYFTDARARLSLCGSGDINYCDTTGEISVTTYKSCDFDTDFATKFTCDLTECGNLYYTDARARLSLCGGTGVTYCDTSGEISIGQDVSCTSNVTFNNITVAGTLNSDDVTASNVYICGDLTVTGTTTTVNSSVVNIGDINILLACGATTPTQANGGGITLGGANACIFYDSVTDTWNLNKDLCVSCLIGQISDVSNHFTCDIAECGNLYYTDARARLSLCGTGDVTYCNTTGEISVTTYKSCDFDTDFAAKFTCDLAECGDLYFTDARARLSLCGTGDITYCNTTGEINVVTYKTCDFDTDFAAKFTCDLAECGDLYFTDARARLSLCGTGDITYCNTTGEISVTTYKTCDFTTDFSTKSIGDLCNVNLSGLADGCVLAYNSLTGNFVPTAPATGCGGGCTSVNDYFWTLCDTNYIVPEQFTATGTTTCFTLQTEYHQYSSLVYVNSIWQRPGCDYTLSNCILDFAVQPDNGDEIYVRAFSRFDIPDGTITLNKLAQGTFVVDCYTGNGNDCVFLLSQDPGDVTHMQVAVGGLMQRPGAGYNLTYSNNNPYITFTAPPDNAVDIEVYLNRLVTPIFGITNDNLDLTYTSNQYTGNGSDICYTIADGHTEDSVLVFLNGILMPPTEYDVIGTTLCFSSPPLSSQEIDIRYMPV